MKVLYDHQIFNIQKIGGISRYFVQIISHLPESLHCHIALQYSNNEYLKNLNLDQTFSPFFNPEDYFFNNKKFKGRSFLFRTLNKVKPMELMDNYSFNKELSINLLKEQDFDIFHPTYYDDYFLEYIDNKPFVLTIHDMIHEIYPELEKDPETSRRKALLANKAAHIIAVSHQTKKDIIEILNIPENKISVVYHANSLNENQNNLDLPKDYFLFVGSREKYKNFLFFVNAIAPILRKNPNLFVLCTGHDFNQTELLFFKNLKVNMQFLYKPACDEHLYLMYKNAKGLVFPSYYEGFGIPILEAFSAGCPVLLSNASCFNEIARNAAIYFPAKSHEELRSTIESLIKNEQLKTNLIKEGYKRLLDFSWEKSAKETSDIYFQVISEFHSI